VNIQNSDSFNEPKIELEDVDSLISFDVFKLENKLSIDLPRTSSILSKPLDSSLIDSLSNKVDNKRETSVNNIFSAKSNYEDYEFSPAIERYLKLARSGKESKEIFESLAIAYYNNSQYDLSTIWFNKLISTYPKNLDPELYFKASVAFKSIEAYEASDRFYKKYLKLNNQLISQNHSEF
jgi:tetratricopeptide (TPR) repeat protein